MFKITRIAYMDNSMNLCQNMLGERFYLPELYTGLEVPFYAVISDKMRHIEDVSPMWDEMINGDFKVIGAAFQQKKSLIKWLQIPLMESVKAEYEPDNAL